jgi:flagellar basal-body rod modification protein FlgD
MPDAIAAGGLGALAPQSAQATDAFSALDSQAFLRLLVAQLRYQNPMSPSDPSAMLQQTSQLRQVETLNQMAKVSSQLLGMQQASMASSLVGKSVTALDEHGATVAGIVDSVRFTPAGPVLLVGDREVPMDGTAEIRSAPPAADASAPAAAPPDPDQPTP